RTTERCRMARRAAALPASKSKTASKTKPATRPALPSSIRSSTTADNKAKTWQAIAASKKERRQTARVEAEAVLAAGAMTRPMAADFRLAHRDEAYEGDWSARCTVRCRILRMCDYDR